MPALNLPRTGIGVDVHAFAAEDSPRPLWVAGLLWAGERGHGQSSWTGLPRTRTASASSRSSGVVIFSDSSEPSTT